MRGIVWLVGKAIPVAGVVLTMGLGEVSTVSAQVEPAPSKVKVDVNLGAWISTGNTRWSHNASSVSPLGNPTSRLTYADHTANIPELTIKISVGPRWFGRLNVGVGDINGGRLTDDDFLVQDRGTPSLQTHSDIKSSNMVYLNAEGGAKLLNYAHGRGALDGIMGFQYWHEEHKAYGVRQISCSNAGATVDLDPSTVGVQPLCNPGATPTSSSLLAITNKATWFSVRTGVQTEYKLSRWLSVQGTAMFKPLSIINNEDTHNLRGAELQSPSFTMTGVGVGADGDASLKISLNKYFSMNIGYRVWWNRILDGTWKNHPVSGSSQSYPLTQFESIRHGATFGLTASF